MITTDINRVKNILEKNCLVAIPTETVYGLAGNAYNDEAVTKIYELKRRPLHNPLILQIGALSQMFEVATDIPEKAIQLALQFWPGPLTLVLKKMSHISNLISAKKNTVALRIPHHPLTLSLLQQLNFPLAAPSANPFGRISPTSAQHVHEYFGDSLEAILDGGICMRGIESTIIGFENDEPILYRHGSIHKKEIEDVIGKVGERTQNNLTPQAPGMMTRHYAPNTRTFLVDHLSEALPSYEGKKWACYCFKILWNISMYRAWKSCLLQGILGKQRKICMPPYIVWISLIWMSFLLSVFRRKAWA